MKEIVERLHEAAKHLSKLVDSEWPQVLEYGELFYTSGQIPDANVRLEQAILDYELAQIREPHTP